MCMQAWRAMACLSDNWASVSHGRVLGQVTTSWCICWASERVQKFWRRGSELTNWIVPSNQGKTLTFAFPLNQSRQRKSPPFRGNLFDVWMSKCVRPLLKHIHAFRALGRVWVFRSAPAGKPFLSHFFLHVGCLAVRVGRAVERAGRPCCSSSWYCCTVCLYTTLVRANKSSQIGTKHQTDRFDPEEVKPAQTTKLELAQLFSWWKINSYQAFTSN